MKNRNRRFWKRALAMLLTICMVMTTLVGNAFAFSLADIPVLFAGEEKQENRAELKDYFFFSDKVSIYLTSSKLRETALEAIQNGQTVDPEEIHRAVSSDAGLAKDYNEFFFSGREVYEITLPEEVKETMADSGLDFRAFVRSGNVADDYKEKGAVQENAGNLKNLVLYKSGSSLDFLMSEADLNPAIREARNDDYTLTGNEEIAFVFFNNTDEKETFVLNIDNKNYCSVKVGSRETALRGLLKEVQKILKKQAKAQAKEDGEDEDKPVKASGSSAAKASGSNAAVASGSDAVIASASDAEKDPAVFLDQEEADEIERNFDAYAEDSSAGKFVTYTLAELAMDHYQNTDVEGYGIEVFVNKDAFSEPVTLKVTKLVKPEEAEQAADDNAVILSAEQIEMLQKKGAYENSQSFDVRFENAAGAEIEPKGTAKVRITADKAVLPEGVDVTSMQVFHMKENASGKIEKVENLTGEDALSASMKLLDDQDQELLSLSAASEDGDDAAFEATGAVIDDTASAKGIAAPEMTEEETEAINAQTAKIVADVVVESFSTITLAPVLKAAGDPVSADSVGNMTVTLVGWGEVTDDKLVTGWNAKNNEMKVLSYYLNFKKDGLSDKQLLVKVPTGWFIKGVSTPESSTVPTEITAVTVDDEYKDAISSVEVGPATGDAPTIYGDVVGDTWADQHLDGYRNAANNSNTRPYGGDILFKFADDAQTVGLVVQLAPQQYLLSHYTATEDMPPVVSTMSATRKSDGETLTDEVSMHAQVRNIPTVSWGQTSQGIDGKGTAYIPVSGEFSDVFGVGSKNNNYNGVAAAGGSYNSLLDEMEQTYTYPEGVYFAESIVASDYGLGGVEKGGTNIAKYKTAEETLTDGTTVRTYVYNPLLTITVEEKPQGGGTVKFSFTKTAFHHASSYPNLVSYFRARTAADPEHPEWKYYSEAEPRVKLQISGWLKRNHEEPKNLGTLDYTRILMFNPGGAKDIDLGKSHTITRVDLMNGKPEADDEAGMGITVDEMIGSRNVTSKLEYSNTTFYYENLTPEKVQVTGVQMHGKNIKNVVVNTVNGENLVIPDSAITNNTSQHSGIYLTKKALADAGMQEGDYIRSVRFTGTVVQGTYYDTYTYGSFAYDGHFVEGLAEGETVTGVLRILKDLPEDYVAQPDDDYAEYGSRQEDIMTPLPGNNSQALLITKTGWSDTGVGSAAAYVGAAERPQATQTTFYPNDDMYFSASVTGGKNVFTSDTIASPILIITLPEEVPLDTDYGVTAKAAAGSGSGAEVKMELLSRTTEVRSVDDVERKYTVYRYEVKDPTQLVGREDSNCGGASSVVIYAKAHVNQNCPESNLKLTDVIRWDLRRTAKNASSSVNYVYADTTARAGHGSDYALAAAGADFAIKPLIGLNMDLSLRAVFDANYHTYNGQKDSVSLVQPTRTAYMKLEYESTSLSDYYKNTSILLPIPKKGKDYKKYFENVALVSPGDHEGEEENTKKFDFSFYLNEYPEMVATDDSGVTWTTYYAIATDGAAASNSISKNDYTSESGLDDWEPAMKIGTDGEHLVWLTEDELRARHEFSTQKDALDDVVMLKFVANDNIKPGKTGEAIITVRVDESAEEGQFDYWRAYGKAVTNQEMLTGNWSYSSVVAATPASEQVFGQIFLDLDGDGKYTEGVDELYTGKDVTVSLNNVNGGIITGRDYFENHDGYLQILTDSADRTSDAFLAGGNYIVSAELAGSNKDYVISTTVPTDVHSNGYDDPAVWANDYTAEDTVVKPIVGADDIGVNAGGIFTVKNKAPIMHYFGIALKPVVKAKFNIKKDLGRTWKADDSFKFTVSAAEGTPLPAAKIYNIGSSTEGKQVTTGDITFDKVGDYTYTITEDKAGTTSKGITYDPDPKTVTVKVEPDSESTVPGKLKATVTYSDAAAGAAVFTNTYAATGKAVISGTKSFKLKNGTDIAQEGGEFSFKLEPVSATASDAETPIKDIPMPDTAEVFNTSEGTFSFGDIEYTQGGTYSYKVTEIPGNDQTVEYDTTEYTVVITAVDNNDGTITCTPSVTTADGTAANGLIFANVRNYTPINAQISAQKELHGRELQDGEFEFKLAAVDDANMPADAENGAVTTSNVGVNVTFGEIEYEAPGTYEYTLTEIAGQDDHITYANEPVAVRVVVEPDESTEDVSDLKATVTYDGETDLHTFENIYTPNPVKAEIKLSKKLTGRKWNADDSFSFTLTSEGNELKDVRGQDVTAENPMPDPATIEVTKGTTEADTYSASFGELEFAYEGTYEYTLREEDPKDDLIEYDDTEVTVEVTVTRNASSGKLTAVVTYTYDGNEADSVTFTNVYTPEPVTVSLAVNKTLEGREWLDDDVFSFKLSTTNRAPLPDDPDERVVQVNADNHGGDVYFGEVAYSEAGTYIYNIVENSVPRVIAPGIKKDSHTEEVTVTVTYDEGTGILSAKTEYSSDKSNDKSATAAAFVNTYTPEPVKKTFDGYKDLVDRSNDGADRQTIKDYTFRFTMTAGTNNAKDKNQNGIDTPMPADAENGSVTVENDEEGYFTFGEIEYEYAGTYNYTVIEEQQDPVDHVTKDTRAYDVTVTVTDNTATGKLEAAVRGWKDAAKADPNFTNIYEASPTNAEIFGIKKFVDEASTGRTLAENAYKFSIRVPASQKNNPMPKEKKVGNAADGTFSFLFEDGAFTKVGEYVYYVAETDIPSEADKPDGYYYDQTEYEVVVTVTDGDKEKDIPVGQLVSSVSYTVSRGTEYGATKELAEFENGYISRPTSAIISGTKILEDTTSTYGDRKIDEKKEKEFEFNLSAERAVSLKGEKLIDKDGNLVEPPMPVPASGSKVNNTGDKHDEFAFGKIEFTHAGLYTYTVKESKGDAAGMAYDPDGEEVKTHTVRVLIWDPIAATGLVQKANLFAKVFYDEDLTDEEILAYADEKSSPVDEQEDGYEESGKLEVTNIYTASPTNAVIDGSKIFDDLTNRTKTAKKLKEGEFRFTLTAVGNDADVDTPMPKDSENGTATASNAKPEDNTASYAFGAITYEKEGVYTYTLKEVNDAEKGVKYDETEYTVTVTVVDGQKEAGEGRHVGQLTATVEIETDGETAKKAAFSNTYSANPTKAELKGFKKFIDMTNLTEDRKQLAAGDFSFELRPDGNTAGIKADGDEVVNPMPEGTIDGVATVTNDANGNFSFGEMTFEYVGEYKYTMTEVNDEKDGMIYDPTVYHFTVTVTDEDAELKAVVTMTAGDEERSTFLSGLAESLTRLIKDLADKIVDFFKGLFGIETEAEEGKAEEAPVPVATFTNAYAAEKATASVAVKKTLKDLSSTYKELQEGQFTFTLKASDNNAMAEIPNPMPEGAEDGVATASNAADGSVNFGDMVFQFVGDYTYTVTEVNDGKPGYTYDDTEYTVTVSVTDNENGRLSAEVSYDPEEAEFRNTYKSEKTTLDELDGWKQLTGKPLDQGEFKFEITAEKAEMLKGGDITDEDGKVLTAPLPKETVASNSNAEHMDDEYTGTYEAPFAFGEIEYEHAGIYTYTVKEQAGTDKRVAYDDTAYTVTVTVEDTEEAKLNVTDITYTVDGEEKDEIRFANTFTFDPKKVTFDATENLWGRTQHAGEFTVLLEPEKESGTTEEAAKGEATIIGAVDRMFNVLTTYAALAASAKNEGEGNKKSNVHFGDVEYKAEDIGKQYYYNMHQVIGTLGGVTYDETNYRIRVTVGVDKADPTVMAALIECEEADGSWTEVTDTADTFVFDNYYKTEGKAELKVKKVLSGRTLAAEEFEFELYETTGGTRTKLATAKNDANGNVTFPAQAYSRGYVVDTEGKATELKDTSGTHTYEISEVKGTLTRVTYDTTVITATVTAADNEDGTMKVTTTFNPGDTFTNYYRTSGGGGGTPSGGNPGGPSRTPQTPETPGAPATPFAPPVLGALPKTGAALGSVMLLALFGILGLFGFARRKKDEDEEE